MSNEHFDKIIDSLAGVGLTVGGMRATLRGALWEAHDMGESNMRAYAVALENAAHDALGFADGIASTTGNTFAARIADHLRTALAKEPAECVHETSTKLAQRIRDTAACLQGFEDEPMRRASSRLAMEFNALACEVERMELRHQSCTKVEIDRDNLRGTLDWIREKVTPYLIGRDFDPKGRATENLIGTLLERYDAQHERVKYLASVAPPLCPSCGCIRAHQPCNADGAITGCGDEFHNTAAPRHPQDEANDLGRALAIIASRARRRETPFHCEVHAIAIKALEDAIEARSEFQVSNDRSVVLSGAMLKAALEFVAPDGTPDQMEAEVMIQITEARTSVDGDAMPAGYYCWLAEYPEEGCVPLFETVAGKKS